MEEGEGLAQSKREKLLLREREKLSLLQRVSPHLAARFFGFG